MVDIADLFKKQPFFSKFDKATIRYLTDKSTEEQYSRNNYVYKQGTPSKHLYIVHSGEFEVLRSSSKRPLLIDPIKMDKSKYQKGMQKD